MSEKKVFLTYKRKRLSSKLGQTQEGRCSNASSEYPADNSLTIVVKHEESSEHCVSEENIRDLAVLNQRSLASQSLTVDSEMNTKLKVISETEKCCKKIGQPKITSPLLTFSRRFKREKDMDGLDTQKKSNLMVIEDINSSYSTSSPREGTAYKSCLKDDLFDLNLPGEDSDKTFLLGQCQNTIKDANLLPTVTSNTIPKVTLAKTEPVQGENSHSILKDSYGGLGDKETRAFKLESCTGEKPMLPGEPLPTDSCGIVDLNLMPHHDCHENVIHNSSETFCNSVNKRHDETPLFSNHTRASKNTFTSVEDGLGYKFLPPPVFSENQTHQVFPLLNTYSEATSNMSSFKTTFQFEREENNQIRQMFESSSSSIRRHKIMLDSILNRAKVSKQNKNRGSFRINFNAYSTLWSEEELDYLWIGVRRHGRYNWEALLKDSGLHFSSWRTANDLKERWDVDQCKILGGSRVSKISCFDKNTRVRELFNNETELSLGDLYVKNARPNFTDFLQRPVGTEKRKFPCSRYEEKNYNMGFSNQSQRSESSSMKKLPRWLNEAVNNVPLRPIEQAMPKLSWTSWINQPHLDPRITNEFFHSKKVGSELPSASNLSLGGFGTGETCGTRYHVEKPDELIVIDSGASSEETISDDRDAMS